MPACRRWSKQETNRTRRRTKCKTQTKPTILDEKFDILKHPNVALSADGKAPPYEHGRTDNAVATISLAPAITAGDYYIEPSETEYELLSNDEIEARILLNQEVNP